MDPFRPVKIKKIAKRTIAARRAASVVSNARLVIAIEMLGAVRALQFRLKDEPGVRLGRGTQVGVQRRDPEQP